MDAHLSKPKKFVLPKFYIRNSATVEMAYEDNLAAEEPLIHKKEQPPSMSSHTNMDDVIVNKETLNITEKVSGLELSADTTITKPSIKPKRQYNKKKIQPPPASEEPEASTSTPKAVRKPSAYNIFIKETLETLKGTHPQLSSKEKFTLAIQIWNERKNNTK